jgi:hypothetical protein
MRAVLQHACLVVDLLSMKLFVWLLGTNGELLDSHLFFYDRYSQLADYHRTSGREAKANWFAAIAEAHFHSAPDDHDPDEAAIAMPIPRPPIFTDAVSDSRCALRVPAKRQPQTDRSHGRAPQHPRPPIHAH